MDFGTLLILGFGGLAVYYLLQQGQGGPPAQTPISYMPGWPYIPPVSSDPSAVPSDGGYVNQIQPQQPVDLESKVQQFAQAIAHAEGFGIPGNIPTTHHNPGDLGPGDCPGYPANLHSGSYVSQLPDDQTGWDFLTNKIRNAFTGHSGTYHLSLTILQWAQIYAHDWQNWANNVGAYLGVSSDTVIADWIAN